MPDLEDKQTQGQETPRGGDPRLQPVADQSLSPLAYYGRIAGWAGSTLLLVALFWAGIKHGLVMPVKIIGIVAIVCIVFWLYTNLSSVVGAIRRRGVQAALSSTLFTIFVLGILVLVNFIGGRHHIFRHDFTKNKQYSLSDATRNIVQDLKEPVTITAFISDEYYGAENLRRLLNEYSYASGKVKVNVYDFKTAVEKIEEYKAAYDGTMFVESGKDSAKKKEEIRGGTEEQITSAILAVSTGEKTKLCFLTGHGEAELDATGEDKRGLTMLKAILENEQYSCEKLSLFTQATPQIPADCKLLVIAGAKSAPSAKEIAAIKTYVDQGGNLLLMLEPPPAPQFAEVLSSHGVTPLNGKITDRFNSAEGQPEILVVFPEPHDVTNRIDLAVLPTATGFDVQNAEPPPAMPGSPPPPQPKAVAVLKSADTAALAVAGDGATRKGPFAMAVAVDETPAKPQQVPGMPEPPAQPEGERKSRIIAVGDSDFTTDNMINMMGGPGGYGGKDLYFAVMSVNWLVKNEKLVAIPPKESADQPFSLTDTQRRFVVLLVIGIIPLLIVAAGAMVWWLRRRS